jgi:hypothetical protein
MTVARIVNECADILSDRTPWHGIRLETANGYNGAFEIILMRPSVKCVTAKTLCVQSDWDFPGLASSFGWESCECGATDGTIDCKQKHVGDEIEDPGYFDSEEEIA